MNLNLVLQALKKHHIDVESDSPDEQGNRVIIVGCHLPMVDYGGRYVYYTLILSPGQDDVSMEERDAMRRRLCHLTTNIFGDDPDFADLRITGEDEESETSHLHQIVPKK
jgi:hypothetical protein